MRNCLYFVSEELSGKFPVKDVLSETLELVEAPLSVGGVEDEVGAVDLPLQGGVDQSQLGAGKVNVGPDLVPVQLRAGAGGLTVASWYRHTETVDTASNGVLLREVLVLPAPPGQALVLRPDDGGVLAGVSVVSRLTVTPPTHPVWDCGVAPLGTAAGT